MRRFTLPVGLGVWIFFKEGILPGSSLSRLRSVLWEAGDKWCNGLGVNTVEGTKEAFHLTFFLLKKI